MELVQIYDPTASPVVATVRLPIRTAYYTGVTSAAAANTRTRIFAGTLATTLQVGNVVCFDPVTGTSGTPLPATVTAKDDRSIRLDGWDVTRPQTSILTQFAGVVYRILEGRGEGPGLIQIVPAAAIIQATVTSAGAIAVGDVLTVVDGSFDLQPIPALGDIGSAALNQVAILNIMRRAVAQAQDVDAGAVASLLRNVRLGSGMHSQL